MLTALREYREVRKWAAINRYRFTQDATYFEHQYGRFWGREAIHDWISRTMEPFPANCMKAFPIRW